MKKRINRLRQLLSDNRLIYCVTVEFPEPRLVEFLGLLGFDAVHIDGEHMGASVADCYAMVRAADAVGMASIVRVPVNRPDVLLAYAETGVNAITAPHIRSVEDAEALVSALTYPPRGTRGLHAGTRAADYGATQSHEEYYRDGDAHVLPMALLEDVEAFESIEALAAVEGLPLYAVGLGDLSGSLGVPGQEADPRALAYRDAAVDAVARNGKSLVLSTSSPEGRQAAAELGAAIVMCSARDILGEGARRILAEPAHGRRPE